MFPSLQRPGLPRDARDQPAALPQLAVVPVHHLLRDLDRGLVILGFKPLAGRDLPDPVKAIKPIVRHANKSSILDRQGGRFASQTRTAEFGFKG